MTVLLAAAGSTVVGAQANCLEDSDFKPCLEAELTAEATATCLVLQDTEGVHCVRAADDEEHGVLLRWSESPADCNAQRFYDYNALQLIELQLAQCGQDPCAVVGVPGTDLLPVAPLFLTLLTARLDDDVAFELDPETRLPAVSELNIDRLVGRWSEILEDGFAGARDELSKGLGRDLREVSGVPAVEIGDNIDLFAVDHEDELGALADFEAEAEEDANDAGEPKEKPWWRRELAGAKRRVRVAIVDSGVNRRLLENLNCDGELEPRDQTGECRISDGLYTHPLVPEEARRQIVSSYSLLHGAEMLALIEEVVSGHGLENQVDHFVFRSLEGTGCVADGAIERAFDEAREWGADIVLTAWTLNGSDAAVRQAATRLAASGALLVTSSIEEADEEPQNYGLGGQLLVAPYDEDDRVRLPWHDPTIFAPGYELDSELLGTTVRSGSSPAAAIVTGAAAVVLAQLSDTATGQDAGELIVENAEQRELEVEGVNKTRPVLDLSLALLAAQKQSGGR